MVKQYTSTERKGINFVENEFLDFEWIFREQPVLDFGIDAQVEVCVDGRPTGRVIALQVKSGVSYFKEETETGVIYRGDATHLNYWTNHSLPVILVLYHPTERHAIWCHIRVDHYGIRSTGAGWCVEVPKAQRLSKDSVGILRNISSPNLLTHARYMALANAIQAQSGGAKFRALLDALHLAEKSIDVLSPFTDSTLFLALAFCSHRVPVRLVTGPHVPTDAIEEYLSGDHGGIEWRTWKELHEKTIILDGFLVVTTSSNFSSIGWRGVNQESVFCSCDSDTVSHSESNFENIWSGSLPQVSHFDLPVSSLCS